MTIREITSKFQHYIEQRGKISDDLSLSRRLILCYLNMAKVKLISEKKRSLDSIYNNSTYAVPLEKVDRSDWPCIPESGCMWLKSKCEIPRTIKSRHIKVNTVLGQEEYNFVKWSNIKWKLESSLPFKKLFFSLRTEGESTYLYIHCNENLKAVLVTGFFSDDTELRVCCGKDEPCPVLLDNEFNIDPELLSPLFDMVAERWYKQWNLLREDMFNNDGNDQTAQVPQK